MVLSLFAVFCASKQQKTIGRLLQPSQLRTFIRLKKDVVLGDTIWPHQDPKQSIWTSRVSPNNAEDNDNVDVGYTYLPSPASCLLLSAPRLLLASSVISFLIALGIYLGVRYTKGISDGHSRSGLRDIFIVYCAGMLFSIFFYAQSSLVQWSQAITDEGDIVMLGLDRSRQAILGQLKMTNTGDFREWRQTHGSSPLLQSSVAPGKRSRDIEADPANPKAV